MGILIRASLVSLANNAIWIALKHHAGLSTRNLPELDFLREYQIAVVAHIDRRLRGR